MRINLSTTPNSQNVPFNHLPWFVGTLHKWIGNNQIHGELSLYSFSQLRGVTNAVKCLDFKQGANFFISFYDKEYIQTIVKTIFDDPEMFCGMKVQNIVLQETPDFKDIEYFRVASPIFIKRSFGETEKHYLYTDPESPALLKETLLHKMKSVNLVDNSLDIWFDKSYKKATTKLLEYRGIKNKVSLCPVIIKGKPETKEFAWNVGIGNSTGIGFGALE